MFRPGPQSVWWIRHSSDDSVEVVQWGDSSDKPVPGDYDGDGKTDVAIYRNGAWWIRLSSNGTLVMSGPFGTSGDVPIPAAYLPN
jgi:hypothetical protein